MIEIKKNARKFSESKQTNSACDRGVVPANRMSIGWRCSMSLCFALCCSMLLSGWFLVDYSEALKISVSEVSSQDFRFFIIICLSTKATEQQQNNTTTSRCQTNNNNNPQRHCLQNPSHHTGAYCAVCAVCIVRAVRAVRSVH